MAEDLDTKADKSRKGSKGGRQKLDANALDALWDEVQAKRSAGLGWKAPESRCENVSVEVV